MTVVGEMVLFPVERLYQTIFEEYTSTYRKPMILLNISKD